MVLLCTPVLLVATSSCKILGSQSTVKSAESVTSSSDSAVKQHRGGKICSRLEERCLGVYREESGDEFFESPPYNLNTRGPGYFDVYLLNGGVQILVSGLCLTEKGYQQAPILEPCTAEKSESQTFRWDFGENGKPGYIKPLKSELCLDLNGDSFMFYNCKSNSIYAKNQQFYMIDQK